jgi:quaternary ammonium compound-resistance protein SugE
MSKGRKVETMAWTSLFIASVFEILFALGLKYTEGFTRLVPSVLTVAAGVASFLILSQSLKTLPVGTGYAMWTGIGAVGTTILGILLFHEPRDVARLVSIGLIISGIIGLRLTSATAG